MGTKTGTSTLKELLKCRSQENKERAERQRYVHQLLLSEFGADTVMTPERQEQMERLGHQVFTREGMELTIRRAFSRLDLIVHGLLELVTNKSTLK